jgi:hypothetical protein
VVHLKVVQSLLGHSSITQTMDTYSQLMEDMGGDAVGGLVEASGQTGCSKRGPAEKPGLTFYLQIRG